MIPTCPKTTEIIQRLLGLPKGKSLSDADRLHIQNCPVCQQEVEAQKMVDSFLDADFKEFARTLPAFTVGSKLAKRLQAPGSIAPLLRPTPILILLTVVATVTLGFILTNPKSTTAVQQPPECYQKTSATGATITKGILTTGTNEIYKTGSNLPEERKQFSILNSAEIQFTKNTSVQFVKARVKISPISLELIEGTALVKARHEKNMFSINTGNAMFEGKNATYQLTVGRAAETTIKVLTGELQITCIDGEKITLRAQQTTKISASGKLIESQLGANRSHVSPVPEPPVFSRPSSTVKPEDILHE